MRTRMTRLLLGLLAVLLWTAPAHTAVLLQEDWEGTDSDVLSRWPSGYSSCGASWPRTSSPGISTTRAYSGTHSLRFHFTGHQQSHINAGLTGPGTLGTNLANGCFSSALIPLNTEIWLTWYEWIESGFQMDEITTKSWLIYGARGYGDQYQDFVDGYNDGQAPSPGDKRLGLALQSVLDGTNPSPWGNSSYQATYDPPFNTWVCYEQRLKMNDPGVANAAAELYATNMTLGTSTVTAFNFQNRQWRGTNSTDPWPPTLMWGSIKVYVQDGIGDIYRDKITVSTTRVGCPGGATGTSDTTPPAIPLGLAVR